MCGIFGIVADRNAPYTGNFLRRSLMTLARESQSRGKDSSGLVFCDEPNSTYHVIKGALKLGELLDFPVVKHQLKVALAAHSGEGPKAPFAAIGHSRLVTNGSQLDDENNQPIVKDDLVGVHNGIIVNDAALWGDNPDLQRHFRIDTEVMLALVRKELKQGYTLPSAIARTEQAIEGTVSTALLVPDVHSLLLFTNHGSLYTLTNNKDILFFASEYHPLSELARKLNIDTAERFEIRQLATGHGVIVGLDPFSTERFAARDHIDRVADTSASEVRTQYRFEVATVDGSGPKRELVRDVALIAKAPNAAKFERLLEHNHDRISKLRRCSKCLLPETFPFISFNAQGVCNYCRYYKVRNQPKPMDELQQLLEHYRRKDGKPDCIVPFSGGRDSTFALHMIKTRLGFNPIAYTYDWGMVTDLGRRNIARVCGKLGVENIIVAADIHKKRDNIRKNINAWLKKPHLGMIPLFMAGDKYFYYYVDQVRRQTGIKLNIWGVNPMENTDFKVGFLGVAPDHDKKYIYSLSMLRQLKLFWGVGRAVLSNPSYLNSSVPDTLGSFASRTLKPHRDYFHLYDYLLWDEKAIDAVLFDEYDWERAVDTNTTWRIGDGTAAFYNYIYYTVAGFSEHDTFRSNQIREGVLTREKGLKLINEENHPRYPTIRWYTDAVHVDYEHAMDVINKIPKLYT
jgi:glucosamine--fructose-6-phosphate aminotransferase (isomerizing)